MFIGEESRIIKTPAMAFVLPRTPHWIQNLKSDRELHYLTSAYGQMESLQKNPREDGTRSTRKSLIAMSATVTR